MDLLYTGNFDGFCIVSSDSDFTRLACRLRESGLFVYGFGKKQTPTPFQKACDKFTYTEILGEQGTSSISSAVSQESKTLVSELQRDNTANSKSKKAQELPDIEKGKNGAAVSRSAKLKHDQELISLLETAHKAAADEDGWASLGAFGSQINKIAPAFDSRNYEYSKLGQLIREIGMFEVQEVPSEHNPVVKVLLVRLKD